jgi:UDP-MurNAc hydroxylase
MARTPGEPGAGSGFDDLGAGVQITYLGHAGLRIDTAHGSVLCDPWTNPCYFGSWFVFPDNSGLDWARLGQTDYLYVSHLHQDHFDPVLLRDHVSHAATVLLPDFPVPDLRERLQLLGFTRFLTVPNGEAVEVGGLRLMIEALKSPADGPLGDSALAVSDGTATVLNQNDARPIDLEQLLAFGPFDAHFLQFSGAIWWPWTYELPTAAQRSFGAAKRANGLDRALRYVKSVGARHVVPSAGPPCFLDEELFALNDLTGDEANTFPDQTVFTEYLSERGVDARLMVPGAVLDVGPGHCEVTWPDGEARALAPFRDKERYLRAYARRERPRIEADKLRWPAPGVDVLAELKAWFEPVLDLADHIRAGVGGPVLLRLPAGDGDGEEQEEQIVIDFPAGQVRRYAGESCRYEFTIARPLIERLIADHQVDWVNSLFLSMRFRARRIGQYNEYIYTFFKCLAPERIMYAEGWYASRQQDEEDIQLGDWIVQRRCPHLRSDLSRFGVVEGTVLTCTMHGWKYDLTTGRCLTHDTSEHRLRVQAARARDYRSAAQGSLPGLLRGCGGNLAGGERLDGGPRVITPSIKKAPPAFM